MMGVNNKQNTVVGMMVLLTVLSLLPSHGIFRADIVSLCLGVYYMLPRKWYRVHKFQFGAGEFCLLLTTLFSYLIHFWGMDTFWSFIIFLKRFFIIPFVLYIKLNSSEKVLAYLKGLVSVFTVYSVIGIVESFTGINIFEMIYGYSILRYAANDIRFGLYRSFGFCTISINNCMLMFMVWCIANYCLFSERGKKIRLVICWAIIGIYTILILSKAVMIVAIIAQVLLFRRHSGSKLTSSKVLKTAVVVLVLILVWNSDLTIIKYFKNMYIPIINQLLGTSLIYDNEYSAGGFGERFQLVSWVWEECAENRLFGVGYIKQFNHAFTKISAAGNRSTWYKVSIENTWLYYLFRTGLFGLSGFIIYQIGCIKRVLSCLKAELNKYNLSYVMLVMTLGYFILILTCYAQEDLTFYFAITSVFCAYITNMKQANAMSSH